MSIYSEWRSASRSVSAGQALRQAEIERGQIYSRPAVKVEQAEELPLLQRLAMLQMMNSTLARGVMKRVLSLEQCQDKPSLYDYRALVAHGFAYKTEEDRWHTLTPEGSDYARKMFPRLCREYEIHIMSEDRGKESTYYKCCCGMWSTIINGKPGRYQFQRAQNRFYAHLPAECKRAESA